MRNKIAAMLAGSSLLALVSPALAQPVPQNTPAAAAKDESEEDSSEIVVTGTFIRGIAPTGNQVLGVTSEDIETLGANSSNDVLASIPQLGGMFNGLNSVGINGNAGPGTTIINQTIQVTRPSLRNIGANTAGSSPTLVLMDGHRIVGAGVSVASPDAGVIPPGVVERVEVVTDGGTALYGTDAVGGVINFITRRSFDGVRLTGRYGIGDEYENYDTSLTGGVAWGSGSAYAAISYNNMSPVFGIDRDWNKNINWNPNAPFSRFMTGENRQCELGNVAVGTTNYAINPNMTSIGAINSYNACDATDFQTLSPEQEQSSLFAGLSQEFGENIELNVRGFFTRRDTTASTGPYRSSVIIDDEVASTGNAGRSPYYIDVPGAAANGALETVNFNFAPVNGNTAQYNYTQIEEWGITPTLTVDLPAEWQLNLVGNYGWSETQFRNPAVHAARLQYYASCAAVCDAAAQTNAEANFTFNTTTGATGNNINPYNIAASNPAILADILNRQRYGSGELTLTNFRAVFDGPLIALPGGEVRGAFGAEFIQEEMAQRLGNTNLYNERALPERSIDRDVTAFFGELNIPIVGEGNNFPLMESLTLSLSARHDDYSDFGETTNPQVGLVWELVDWFSLRANWGTSFNAPSPLEVLNQAFPALQVVLQGTASNWGPAISASVPAPGGFPAPSDHGNLACFLQSEGVAAPGVCASPGGNTPVVNTSSRILIALNGARQGLEPQTGETWSTGFDAYVPFLPSLRVSATYYHVEFANSLLSFQNILPFPTATNYTNWSNFIFINGYDGSGPGGAFTTADIDAYCGLSPDVALCATARLNPSQVLYLVDTRFDNFSTTTQEGVDASLRYSQDLGWGSLDLGLSGNYRLNSETQSTPFAALTSTDLDLSSRYNISANAALTVGDLYGRLTVNYSAGFHATNPVTAATAASTSGGPFQNNVDPFYPVDLFVRYDLGELGLADNLQLTLNVDNVFDDDPPIFRSNAGNGSSNGNTLGRVVSVGFSADF